MLSIYLSICLSYHASFVCVARVQDGALVAATAMRSQERECEAIIRGRLGNDCDMRSKPPELTVICPFLILV